MRIDKTIGIIGGIFILAGIGSMLFLPGEKKWNKDADIRVGSGADISGVIMEETLQKINEKYKVSTSTESSSFQDCCSNTAQWALNAKEINVGFYCPHIAKHTIKNNEDVEIYGPVLMNGETIVYKKDWADVKNVGITQGRQQEKALAKAAYPQIEGFDEITQKGILYAMEDEQVDAAILDITKAAEVSDIATMPLSDNDYISYVLIVDKEFEQTEAFRNFIESYNKAVEKLNDPCYLAKKLKVSKEWVEEKQIKFLQVLKDVSFEIEEGQFVCLLGPSGCGKTTTLTIVAGFQKPTEGIIEVNGNVVTKPGPDRAFMFQNYALFPWLKVGENIEYPMKKMKVPKEERKKKLKELLEMAQLTKYENYYIHEISGGMKQRVALLRALACDPKVLLMDEPLGAVDFQMRQLLQRQLEDILGQKKTTSLMVTHDVDESVYLSDRVIVMSRDHGKILEDLKIDLPRPRDRTNPQYHAYVDQLTEILKSALSGGVYTQEDKDIMEFIQGVESAKKPAADTAGATA